MIGDELGDVRRALARLAQHLGGLERLTEEARVDARRPRAGARRRRSSSMRSASRVISSASSDHCSLSRYHFSRRSWIASSSGADLCASSSVRCTPLKSPAASHIVASLPASSGARSGVSTASRRSMSSAPSRGLSCVPSCVDDAAEDLAIIRRDDRAPRDRRGSRRASRSSRADRRGAVATSTVESRWPRRCASSKRDHRNSAMPSSSPSSRSVAS